MKLDRKQFSSGIVGAIIGASSVAGIKVLQIFSILSWHSCLCSSARVISSLSLFSLYTSTKLSKNDYFYD